MEGFQKPYRYSIYGWILQFFKKTQRIVWVHWDLSSAHFTHCCPFSQVFFECYFAIAHLLTISPPWSPHHPLLQGLSQLFQGTQMFQLNTDGSILNRLWSSSQVRLHKQSTNSHWRRLQRAASRRATPSWRSARQLRRSYSSNNCSTTQPLRNVSPSAN